MIVAVYSALTLPIAQRWAPSLSRREREKKKLLGKNSDLG